MAAVAPDLAPDVTTGQGLLDYVAPSILLGPAHDYCASSSVAVGLHSAVVVVSLLLMARIMMDGNYWVVRLVKVKHGRIVVPSSSNAAALSWLIYTLVDLICRSILLRWWCHKGLNVHYIVLPITLRYVACFCAMHFHVTSSAIIWPLSPSTVRPASWYFFFLGLPSLALIGVMTPIALATRHFEEADNIYRALFKTFTEEGRLQSSPTEAEIEYAFRIFDLTNQAARCLQGLLFFGAAFTWNLFLASSVIGRKILGRLRSAEKRLSREEDEEGKVSVLPIIYGTTGRNSIPGDADSAIEPFSNDVTVERTLDDIISSRRPTLGSSSRPSHPVIKRKSSKHRLAGENLGHAVKVSEVRRLFNRFFWHLLVETCFIVTLGLASTTLFFYYALTIRAAFADRSPDPRWGSRTGKWLYVFFTSEMWTFLVIGHAYALSVLYRQARPIRLDTSRGSLELEPRPQARRSRPDSPELNVRITQDVIHHISATDAIASVGGGSGRGGGQGRHTSYASLTDGLAGPLEDLTGFVGRGVGRSLVLQALANPNPEGDTFIRRLSTTTAIPHVGAPFSGSPHPLHPHAQDPAAPTASSSSSERRQRERDADLLEEEAPSEIDFEVLERMPVPERSAPRHWPSSASRSTVAPRIIGTHSHSVDDEEGSSDAKERPAETPTADSDDTRVEGRRPAPASSSSSSSKPV